MEGWREAAALAERLGLVAPDVARRATEDLTAGPADGVTCPRLAEALGLPLDRVELLLRLAAARMDPATLRLDTRSAAVDLVLGTSVTAPGPSLTADADAPTLRLPDGSAETLATAASPATAPWRPNVPRRLGPYHLLDELGHGGMGIVYRARHERLGTLCAIKVLVAGEAASIQAIARFQREAAAVAKMGKHPNIVTIHDLGQEGAIAWFSMELVEGKTLRKRMEEQRFSPTEAAQLVERVARALHHAHGHGVIHRDIKPENIVVREGSAEPQVMDFGLARDVSSSAKLSLTGQVMGTPNYMAPEQVRGEHSLTDPRTDVYALGAVLYELLTGVLAHPGREIAQVFEAILRGEVVLPRRLAPEVPRDIETICVKCLDPEPARRYPTAGALAEDLARFQRGEPVAARPVGRLGRWARRIRRHRLLSAAIAASALLALGLAWRFLGPGRLELTTDPASARVEVNGRAPWFGRWVWPPGKLRLRVTDGQAVDEREIDVPAGGVCRVGTVGLYGTLSLDTKPTGASVFLDQERMGETPLVGCRAPIGRHTLSIRLDQYKEWVQPARLTAWESMDLGTVRLEHEQGMLWLDGNPVGMSVGVYRKGAAKPTTWLSPSVTERLNTGDYELNGWMKDHFTRWQNVRIEAGRISRVRFSLAQQVLWKARYGGTSRVAMGDVDGDGVLDCVLVSSDDLMAFSGKDGGLLWTYPAGSPLTDTAVLADTNGDGVLDCLVGSMDDRVLAVSGRDGVPLWIREMGEDVRGDLAVGDVDGDGRPDCLVLTKDRSLEALSGVDGAVLWTRETGGVRRSSPAVGDLDGDHFCDYLVWVGEGEVRAFSGRDGSLLWRHDTGCHLSDSPILGETNGDGVPDCIVVSEPARTVAVLDGVEGKLRWSREMGGAVAWSPALGDLNGDGLLDCVVASFDSRVSALSGGDGAILWVREIANDATGSPAVGDVNGDGTLDCVVSRYDNSVCALSGQNGADLWVYDVPSETYAPPALGDVNGDGADDCAIPSSDGLRLLSGREEPLLWAFEAGPRGSLPVLADVSGDGTPDFIVSSEFEKLQALSGRDGTTLWERNTEGIVYPSPSLGDVNADGVPDCFAILEDGTLQAVSGRNGEWLWHDSSEVWSGMPVLADVNRDGVPDCILESQDHHVYAISGKESDHGCLWAYDADAEICSIPSLEDLDNDGVPDCVVGSDDNKLHALSGKDGTLLWAHETTEEVRSAASLGDLNSDGTLDVVIGLPHGVIQALSGRDGSPLWVQNTDGDFCEPVVADVDGDRKPDCVIASTDYEVFALSAKDGTLLWANDKCPGVWSAAALADVNGDGALDCVVAARFSVCALSAKDGEILWSHATKHPVHPTPQLVDLDADGALDCVVCLAYGRIEAFPTPRPRVPTARDLRRMRMDRWWCQLANASKATLDQSTDPWARSLVWLDRGVAHTWLKEPQEALAALAEARALHLRAPDGAVYEWVASRQWKECPAERRAEADLHLLDALGFRPDGVLDAFVECRPLWDFNPADVRALRDRSASIDACAIERSLLFPMLLSDNLILRAVDPEDAAGLRAARQSVAARIDRGEGNVARNLGYLALIAAALGEKDFFARNREAYLGQRLRPAQIDDLVEFARIGLR